MRLARRLLKLGEWAEAKTLLESVDSTSVEASLLRSEAEIRAAREQPPGIAKETLREVASRLEQVRAANPKRADIRVLQAAVTAQLDGMEAAERMLTQAGKVRGTSAYTRSKLVPEPKKRSISGVVFLG